MVQKLSYIPKKDIYETYVLKNLSKRQAAKELGCSYKTFKYLLKYFNITNNYGNPNQNSNEI